MSDTSRECRIWRAGYRSVGLMTVQRVDSLSEAQEEAETEATLAGHDEWVRVGRPGTRPHDDVMAELLGTGELAGD